MKKNILITIIISLTVYLSACSTKYVDIETNNVSLKIPSTMMENKNNIFVGAEIEYEDSIKDIYVVVFKKNKEKFEGTILEYQKEDIELVLRDESLSFKTKDKKIKGTKAIISDVETEDEDGITIWKIALLESETDYFTVWTWTGPDYKDENLITMKKIIKSFKIK